MKIPFSKTLFSNAAIYFVSNIINSSIPFLVLPILTRFLTASEYGVIAMFQATMGILGAFTGLSVHGAVGVRFVDRGSIDYPRYIGSCLFILITSSLLTLGVVFLFRSSLSAFTALPEFWLLMAVLMSCGNFLLGIRLVIWLMQQQPVHYGIFQVSFSLINIGLSLFLVVLMKAGYEGRLWGQSIAIIVFSIFGVASLISAGWVTFRPSWKYIKEAVAFGLPLVPHVIGIFLIGFADRFIINLQLGLAATGIYMVAAQLGNGMNLFADAFNKAFVPWLYEQLKKNDFAAKQRIVKGTWIYFGVALTIAGIMAVLSYWILYIIAGPSYVRAAKALAWLSFGQAFSGMYLMVTNYVFYKRQTKMLPCITVLSGTIGITMTWFLTPVFGITAAGFAFAVAMGLRFLMTWRLSQKVCPMPWFTSNTSTRG